LPPADAKRSDDAGASFESDNDSEDDSEDDGGFSLRPAEEDAPGAGLARRLWHARVVAAAQHRVLRTRLRAAAAAFAELHARLDAALVAAAQP
jgi:hypothetical protein